MKTKMLGISILFIMLIFSLGPIISVSADYIVAYPVHVVKPTGIFGQIIGNTEKPIKSAHVYAIRDSEEIDETIDGVWDPVTQCYYFNVNIKHPDRERKNYDVYAEYKGVTKGPEKVVASCGLDPIVDVTFCFDASPVCKNVEKFPLLLKICPLLEEIFYIIEY